MLTLLLFCGLLVGGCGNGTRDSSSEDTVKVSGSTTVLPVSLEAATQFMEADPEVDVQVQGGGSSVGITQLNEGIVQIANSSRELKGEENDGTLVDHRIAFDIIAIVVNPEVGVGDLTSTQVRGIFTGKIRNWKQVGGPDKEIVAVVRDIASGTREMFDEKALGSTADEPVDSVDSAIQASSNGVVREIVGATGNAIGYLSYGYINKLVEPVSLDGIPPDVPNASSGDYPVARYLHMFTKGEASGAVKKYIDFVLSDDFQNTVVSRDYIPIKRVEI